MESNHAGGTSGRCHVVALPFPGRGHINPMMSLCRLIASRGLTVTFVVTEEWQGLLATASAPPPPPNLRVRSIPDVLPSERTRGAEYRAFYQAVLTKMEAPVEELIVGLCPPADAIIADSLLPWAAAIGRRRRIPVSALFPQSAAVFLALHRLAEVEASGQSVIDVSGKGNECLKYIPRVSFTRLASFLDISNAQNILREFIQVISWFTTAQNLLFTSSYELESHSIDTLRSKLSLPIYSIGPSIPFTTLENEDTNSTESYYKWLDLQPEGSVLYVSLGSFLPISCDQMIEMATGLQMSGVRFLWTARGEPKWMEMIIGDMGLIVPWCDQLKVLCHSSVGGFLTHCGWNSTLEAMFAGVPMLTFPLMWDQYPNSELIVEDWKIGLRLKEEDEGVVGREEIAKVVRRLMMDLDAEESKDMRKKCQQFNEMCRKTIDDKGSSSTNLDAFLQQVDQRPQVSEQINND